ncbi:MAG TPA: hypothetical protein VD905_07830, partial [Flavobacteriales bacterium]|nr:hypothetical protein [Flavobacteriales bacterium]
GIWTQLRTSNVLYLDVDFEKRAQYLAAEYGKFDPADLIEATKRIERRLGPQQTKNACIAISENRMTEACRIILAYYDKAYNYGLSQRDQSLIQRLSIDQYDEKTLDTIADQILS